MRLLIVSLPGHLVRQLYGIDAKNLKVRALFERLLIVGGLHAVRDDSYLSRPVKRRVVNLRLEGEGLNLSDVDVGQLQKLLDALELVLEGHISVCSHIA